MCVVFLLHAFVISPVRKFLISNTKNKTEIKDEIFENEEQYENHNSIVILQ